MILPGGHCPSSIQQGGTNSYHTTGVFSKLLIIWGSGKGFGGPGGTPEDACGSPGCPIVATFGGCARGQRDALLKILKSYGSWGGLDGLGGLAGSPGFLFPKQSLAVGVLAVLVRGPVVVTGHRLASAWPNSL